MGGMSHRGRISNSANALLLLAGLGAAVVTGATEHGGVRAEAQSGQLTLLCTGDVLGRLAPCGCASPNQPMGIAKRTTLLRQLRQEAGQALALDAGNLGGNPGAAQAVIEALAVARYDGVAVGVYDLPSREEIAGFARQHRIRVLRCGDAEAAAGTGDPALVPDVIFSQLGPHRIAVTAALPRPGAAYEDVVSSLVGDLRQVRSRADAVVLLSHLGARLDEALATANGEDPVVDVIVARRSRGERTRVTRVGATAVAIVPSEADAVAVIGLKWGNEGLAVSARTVAVSRDTEADSDVARLVEAYYARQQRTLIADGKSSQDRAPARIAFSPAQECARCHAKQYDRWRGTDHAAALTTLRERERMVPECATCHSDTYRWTKRLPAGASAPDGVQCAACHGDGIVHALTQQRPYVTRKVPESVCVGCHNNDHSPEFSFEAYVERIKH